MSGVLSANWSGSYPTAAWVFRWTAVKSGQGISTVHWTLTKEGRSTSPTWLKTHCALTINSETKYYEAKENGQTMDNSWSFNNNLRASGDFTITHSNDGAGNFTVSLYGEIYDGAYQTTEQLFSLDLNYPYTKCYWDTGAEVTIDKKIQKPGGPITVSWSGAIGGTANSITGFIIETKRNGSTVQTDQIGSTAAAGSTTITLPNSSNDYRGENVKISVRIKGQAGANYYSDSKEATTSCAINRKPTFETESPVSPSSVTIPSTGGEVTFTFNGNDEDEEQTLSYFYDYDIKGENKKLVNNNEIYLNKGSDLYFWVYDGLEFSDKPSNLVKVTLNTKPEINKITISDSFYTPQITEISLNGSPAKKYKYGLSRYENGQNKDIYTIETDPDPEPYTFPDVRIYLQPLNVNAIYYYNIWVQYYDGTEWSDKKYTTESRSFTVPVFELLNEKKQRRRFSRQIRFLTQVGYNNPKFITQDEVVFESRSQEEGYDCIDTSQLGYNQKVSSLIFDDSFEVILGASSLTKVQEFIIEPLVNAKTVFTPDTFNIYETPQLKIQVKGYFGEEYGFNAEQPPSLKLILPNQIEKNITLDSGSGTSYFSYTIGGPDFYEWLSDSKSLENQLIECEISISNEFGDVIPKTFNLNLSNTSQAQVSSLTLKTQEVSLENWMYLCGGMPIDCAATIYAFNSPSVQLQISYDNILWIDSGSSLTLSDENRSEATDLYGYNTKPYTYTLSKSSITMLDDFGPGQVIFFRAKIGTDNDETFNYYYPTNYKKLSTVSHIIPTGLFETAKYTNGKLNLKWQINKTEVSSLTKIEVYAEEKPENAISEFGVSEGQYEHTVEYNMGNNNFLHIAPEFTTELVVTTNANISPSVSYTSTKTTTSLQYVIVYNILPTVSYRKNHLGINVSNPSQNSDAGLVIGAYGDRKFIYLQGPEGGIHKINLDTGNLISFTIDCGSWDSPTEEI